MGNEESKVVHPNANVVNEIIVKQEKGDLLTIEICLILIATLMSLNLLLHFYSLHNKKLKKKYLSRATDLDKI